MREDDLRELFTAVMPPSTLEHRWREAAVLGYVVPAPLRLRTLVVAFIAFVAVAVLTGGALASRLVPAPAMLRWHDGDLVVRRCVIAGPVTGVVMRDNRFCH